MRMTWGQRLAYSSRMTRYLVGLVVGFHLLATIAVLIFGDAHTRAAFHQYLMYLAPVVLCDVLIRSLALYIWRHESTPNTSLIGAITLVYATWPLYLLAWLMATLRLPLTFRPTPKNRLDELNPIWLAPQVIAVLLLVIGIFYTMIVHGHQLSILLLFAVVQGILQLLLLAGWMYSESTFLRKFVRAFHGVIKMASPDGGRV
jgi:hypothetical protein